MECLRGLAALWVFLFHIWPMVGDSLPFLVPFCKEGHRGVPVFFAISGYCIFAAAHRCIREGRSSLFFLQRRLQRIYPTFWASIVVVLAVPYLIEGLAGLKAGSYQAPHPAWLQYGALDWFGVVSLSQGLLGNGGAGKEVYAPINIVYWSRAIEVQFYLVMYAALCARRRWAQVLCAVTAASAGAIALRILDQEVLFLQFWPAFVFGALVRVAYVAGWTPRALFGRRELSASMLALFAFGAGVALAVGAGIGLSFLATAFLAAVLLWLVGGVENGWRARGAGSRRFGRAALPFVLLGQASYSVYLLHFKLYPLAEMFVRQVWRSTSPWYLFATVGLTLALCYGFYRLVERRFVAQPAGAAGAAPVAAPTAMPLA